MPFPIPAIAGAREDDADEGGAMVPRAADLPAQTVGLVEAAVLRPLDVDDVNRLPRAPSRVGVEDPVALVLQGTQTSEGGTEGELIIHGVVEALVMGRTEAALRLGQVAHEAVTWPLETVDTSSDALSTRLRIPRLPLLRSQTGHGATYERASLGLAEVLPVGHRIRVWPSPRTSATTASHPRVGSSPRP